MPIVPDYFYFILWRYYSISNISVAGKSQQINATRKIQSKKTNRHKNVESIKNECENPTSGVEHKENLDIQKGDVPSFFHGWGKRQRSICFMTEKGLPLMPMIAHGHMRDEMCALSCMKEQTNLIMR